MNKDYQNSLVEDNLDLAITDSNYFKILKSNLTMRKNQCSLLLNMLQIIKNIPQKFTKIRLENHKELILYTHDHWITISTCTKLRGIDIEQINPNQCHKDMPVKFKVKDKILSGFLTND